MGLIGGNTMKIFKRVLACFLVNSLFLILLTGCSGSQGQISGDYNNNISNLQSVFQDKGFTKTPDYEALVNISEKYAKKIALDPSLYLTYNTPPMNNMIASWSYECNSFFSSQTRAGVAYLLTLDGSVSESNALTYYKNKSQMVYDNFQSLMERNWLTGPTYYFVYTTHVTNPENVDESIWITYEILYLEVE